MLVGPGHTASKWNLNGGPTPKSRQCPLYLLEYSFIHILLSNLAPENLGIHRSEVTFSECQKGEVSGCLERKPVCCNTQVPFLCTKSASVISHSIIQMGQQRLRKVRATKLEGGPTRSRFQEGRATNPTR